METALSLVVGCLFATAIYLLLSKHIIRMLLGVVLLGNAVNLLIFTAGRLTVTAPPIIPAGLDVPAAATANPLPQALILTAIVISFSFFSFLLVLAYRAYQDLGTDDTDKMRIAEPEDEGASAPRILIVVAVSESLEVLKGQAMVEGAVAAADQLVVLPVVLAFLFGATLLALRRRVDWHPFIAVPGLFLIFAVDAMLLRRVALDGPQTMMMSSWKAPFGIAFTVDLMGALFLAVAGFVALACGIYAVASVSRQERRYGFFPLLFLMMGGVSGAFLTGDIFNLYVWFEVLLIGSFGLLILGSERGQLDAATKYAFLNLVGTTLFLITTGYLYGVFGTLNMADITIKAAALQDRGPVYAIGLLYLVAFSLKAAAFPLNSWLPASYHTPRFVVSALFAGLLTKVGVYALIRVLMMLFPVERAEIAVFIAWIAGLTMIVGALGALAQTDLRRLLNYFVIAGIGTILAGTALPLVPDDLAVAAGAAGAAAAMSAPTALQTGLSGSIYYALHSIVVMTALYLAAGIASFLNGSSSLHEMGGLWRRFPLFAALMLIFLLGVSGLPPFSGFWPKVTLVRATLVADLPWLAAAILVSGFLLTIASARVFALAFWRPLPALTAATGPQETKAAEEAFRAPPPNAALALVPLLGLAIFVIAAGIWPEWLAGLTNAAASGILDPSAYISSVFGGAP